MTITINEEKKEFAEGLNILGLLEAEGVQNPDMLSVIVNDSFVHKSVYTQTSLKDGDSVTFLYFMGGGA
jgi:sulfur carrier protein